MEGKIVPFKDLLCKIVDNRGRTCPTATVGRPLIATNCIKNELLYPAYEKLRFVDEHTYRTWFRGHPEPGDLLFVTKGTPGRVCMAPDPANFCIAQDMVAIRADETKIYPKFLFAILRSRLVQEQIESLHVGTLIPHFKKGDFDKLQLHIPDKASQRFIGDIYFNLSAKIELNRRMNRTLEDMARAIFKSWFVDFDPVRTKAAGQQPPLPAPQSGAARQAGGLKPEIADLFPDSFEDSELGEIPKGWRVGTLGMIAQESREAVKPADIEANSPYIALEHIPKRCIALNSWGTADGVASGKLLFRQGDILFGKLRPYFHKVGPAPVDGVCSTDIVVIRPKNQYWYGLVTGHVFDDAFVAHTDRSSAGTKMPRTNWRDMAAYTIAIPSADLAKRHTHIVLALLDKIRAGIIQSRTLAALRDTLLPKLISGELRVPDAERIVGRCL